MTNLEQLRILRNEIKEREALISQISGDAVQEAVDILAAQNRTCGEFTTPEGHTFQLQRTEIFDFADYRRYPHEQAVKWREAKKQHDILKAQSKALTALMNGYTKQYAIQYAEKMPDEIKLTVKTIE